MSPAVGNGQAEAVKPVGDPVRLAKIILEARPSVSYVDEEWLVINCAFLADRIGVIAAKEGGKAATTANHAVCGC